MSKKSKPPKPRFQKKDEPCYCCGSEKIEQIAIHGVGVIRICKECKEQQ
jgi:hypothetical protein